MNIAELIARWDSNEGKPYKGRLIDYDDYYGDGVQPPSNIGCMCAQGQVLHLLGGWTPQRLYNARQAEADKATATLLNISIAHAILLRNVNDGTDGAPSIVLTRPEQVIGDQASKLLDFWWALDQMDFAARDAARAAARAAVWGAARAAARAAVWGAAWDAARAAAGAAARAAAGAATAEIMGVELLKSQGRAFFFLPMFGFASPDDIPARPALYGLGV